MVINANHLMCLFACIVFSLSGIVHAQDVRQQSSKQQRHQKLMELRQRDYLALKSKVHPAIREKVNSGNTVPVIVHLSLSQQSKRNPTQEDDAVRKSTIAAARNDLVTSLIGPTTG